MNPDKMAIIGVIIFFVLGISHYIALKVGWNMGVKGDFNKVMSTPKQKKIKSGSVKYIDPFKAERLD